MDGLLCHHKDTTQHPAAQLPAKNMLCMPIKRLFSLLGTSPDGLATRDARKHLHFYGHNELAKRERKSPVMEFLGHFNNPLVLILLAAGAVSGLLGEIVETITIFVMVLLSVTLSFVQEHRASKAADELRRRVATTATAMRDGAKQEVRLTDLVPGDVILLQAGDVVPADARVMAAKDFFVDQSALTGESFPAEKSPEPIPAGDVQNPGAWRNYLFMGTSVVSGTATAVIVRTGQSTQYGEIARATLEKRPQTEFERGLGQFGYFIMRVTFGLVIFVFVVLAIFKHNILESVLFALALAVGLTPELLPMIVSINLSSGAANMSKKKVIVKRLASIHNLGAMDVLCSDKTGTLTENRITLIMHVDMNGKDSAKVLEYSFINSSFQTGLRSPLDDAIMRHEQKVDSAAYGKIDEIPFDFNRRRSSVVAAHGKRKLLITKGAPEDVWGVCSTYELDGKVSLLDARAQKAIESEYRILSKNGFRTLAIGYRPVGDHRSVYDVSEEENMTFLGYIAFIDPPKQSSRESVDELQKDGIKFKILTGDSELVTKKICEQLDIRVTGMLTGNEVAAMNDDALARMVEKANVFARVTPAQKNRILLALKSNGHVVGYLGDGINDAPSMHIADVSISVDNAVDVARESADIILLKKDLRVLADGVLEGRKTFSNTMKYVLMGVSSNFGNMLSVAIGSLFLPFLPMTPIQILLNNLLYDTSQSTISTDNVDPESMQRPRRLSTKYIRKFMLYFGPISSIFDILTFLTMLYVFRASIPMFQTGWFIESLCTQSAVILAIRTRKIPFLASMPSTALLVTTFLVISVAVLLPFTPVGAFFGLVPLPTAFYAILTLFVIIYLMLIEGMKWWFYKNYEKMVD